MTIASELTTLNTTKTNIRAAIEAKGVTVGAVPFADYPSKIAEITGGTAVDTPPAAWVRNPSWPQISAAVGDNKVVGLYAVWPGQQNWFAMTISGAYTINYGDGTTTNYTSGSSAYYAYDYSNANLANTDAPVTFTASTSTVNRTAHGYTNGQTVQFYNIVTTTGIDEEQIYYVINATTDTFQVSATSGGTAITLAGDGSATLLPYKIAVVTITPQSGQNLTSVNFNVRNTSKSTPYLTGWLDVRIALPNLTTLTLGSSSLNVYNYMLESVKIVQAASTLTGSNMFQNLRLLRSVEVSSSLTLANCTSMFEGCETLTEIPTLNTSNTTVMSFMFANCYSLYTIPLLDTSKVTNMSGMFSSCASLSIVPQLNTSSVTNMSSFVSGCVNLLKFPLLDTSKVTTMSNMFNFCRSLQEVPLLNTALVTDMSGMFLNCASLANIPQFNTVNVTNMSQFFQGCSALVEIPLLDTAKVTNMSNMFNACNSLRSVPLLNTGLVNNMANMFVNCYRLPTIPLFNTANVTNMTSMFEGCYNLLSVPLLNTVKVTNMSSMFISCRAIESIPKFNTAAVTTFNNAFNSAFVLKRIPDLVVTAVTSSSGFSSMFSSCNSLSRIRAKDFRFTFSVANCNLGPVELNEIYTNLPTVTGQTITVTGNWGTATDDPTIATTKGWTVSG